MKKVVSSFIDDKETEINERNIEPVFTDLKYDPYILYAKFNNITYKIAYDAKTYVTKSVEVAYKFEGREGEEVKYDSNGDGIDEDWVITTDRGGKVEITSRDVAKDEDGKALTVGLGVNILATNDISGDGNVDDIDTALLSYNNAITTINNFCESIVKPEIRDKVRSVGGTNNNTKPYYPDNYEEWGKNIRVEIASGDEYYKEDYEKMKYLGILNASEWYWMSSRTTGFAFGKPEEFRVKCIGEDGILRRTSCLECEFQL